MALSTIPFVSRLTIGILLTLWIGTWTALSIPSAMALTIIRKPIPSGEPFQFDGLQVKAGAAPTRTIGDGNLIQIVNAAADAWEQVIKDEHTVTIQFGWSPLPVGGGFTGNLQVQYHTCSTLTNIQSRGGRAR